MFTVVFVTQPFAPSGLDSRSVVESTVDATVLVDASEKTVYLESKVCDEIIIQAACC
jgi:hypothetical protein